MAETASEYHDNVGLSIAERCVLIDFGFSMPKLTAVDREATEQARLAAGAEKGAAATVKKLYKAQDIKTITSLRNEIRSYHLRMTLPWLGQGVQILPTDLFLEYSERMRAYRKEWDKAVETFVTNYGEARIRAKHEWLGTMFDQKNYPPPTEVREKFEMRVNIMPVPTSGDFRVDVGEDAKRQLELATMNAIEATKDALRTEIVKYVGRLAEVSKKQRVHDTIITNVLDMCDRLPSLNLSNDPALNEIRRDMEKAFSKVHPDDLKGKDGEETAKQVEKDANKIMDKMAAFGW